MKMSIHSSSRVFRLQTGPFKSRNHLLAAELETGLRREYVVKAPPKKPCHCFEHLCYCFRLSLWKLRKDFRLLCVWSQENSANDPRHMSVENGP